MGTFKILVLCSLFFVLVALSEEIIKTQVKSIDTRCKRETEIDIHAREHKPKVSCRKSTKLLIPITKRFNSINAKPHKALPRRNLVPVATKPRVVNTTKDEIKQPEVVQTNDSKSNNDAELKTIEPNELTRVVNLTTVDNKNKNGTSKNEEIKENPANDNTDLPTVDEGIEDDKIERKEKKLIGILAETIKTENEENLKNQTSHAEVNQVPTKEVKTPATNPAKQLTSPNILNQFKVPGILIQSRRKPSKTGNKPKPVEEKGLESSKLPRSDASTEPLNDIDSKTEAKKFGDQIPKMVSLTILTDQGKIPIVTRINPLKAPTNIAKKETNESTLLPQTYAENQIKITTGKPEHKTSDQSSKTELEEIVIQNNNYEEVYEPSTSQYTTPKLITTELRSAPNLNNFETISSQYDNKNPQAYEESKSYSYDVTKYPDQYVVNAYEDEPNIRQNFDFPLDPINLDINAKQKYTNTLNSWPSQSYNQLEAQEAGGSFNLENINQRQEYPRRIWRSWKNNLIYLRPKYGNGINTELYKGLGRYLANVNPQGATYIHNCNGIGSSVYENLSTSPYVNRLQYTRYGY